MSVDALRAHLAVYLVADPEATAMPLVEAVQAALDGGVTAVQLRAKRLGGYDQFRRASQLVFLCEQYQALFIVNDRLDIALAVGAAGVHLGTSDLPVDVARRMVPPGFVIGFSPQSVDDVEAAAQLGADYVGIGPVFATGSKDDAQAPLGLDGLSRQIAASRVPTVAIGGITATTAGDIIAAGAAGVAVISAILGAADPTEAAQNLSTTVSRALGSRPSGSS